MGRRADETGNGADGVNFTWHQIGTVAVPIGVQARKQSFLIRQGMSQRGGFLPF
jgi:hypothetical protein